MARSLPVQYRLAHCLGLSACLALASATALAAESAYSPYVDPKYPTQVYWGDTHVHTEMSMDANSMGNRLNQEQAYRFAKGETVVSSSGVPMKLDSPLDFIVLADHAEFMGFFPLIRNGDRRAADTGWLPYFEKNAGVGLLFAMVDFTMAEDAGRKVEEMGLVNDENLRRSVWEEVTKTADRYNEPGKFTAFIGYEWTASPRGDNLHRNVILRDGADRASQLLPFSAIDSSDPEDLWRYLEQYELVTGGRALAIPHNGNLSNGLMFSAANQAGEALSASMAKFRMRWEPLVEVTQIKGDGESHPALSPDDEFADFETWDGGNLGYIAPKQEWMLQHEYARSALNLGQSIETRIGANPFKFGMIGSSDTHTSLAAVGEDNFIGKFATLEPGQNRLKGGSIPSDKSGSRGKSTNYSSSGYAAVWATENTRESLFDALLRKETYATTGPRMTVRFFAGWNYDPKLHLRSDFVKLAYETGVPMGGDLPPGPEGKSPSFLVLASKAPDGANLDRIQIVKGWIDHKGEMREKVFDVALSDGRRVDPKTGKAPRLHSTVDVETATYTNSIGATQLATVWEDPDFDARSRAFYYVRVLEIPTPRWPTYEAMVYSETLPAGAAAELQERAYTSPIWYSPN